MGLAMKQIMSKCGSVVDGKKGTNDFKRNAELLKGNILNNSLTPL